MQVECVSCYLIACYMLSCDRREERGKLTSASDDDEEPEVVRSGELPGYISVLFTAHDFLGK
jgi:hypothetical protein